MKDFGLAENWLHVVYIKEQIPYFVTSLILKMKCVRGYRRKLPEIIQNSW